MATHIVIIEKAGAFTDKLQDLLSRAGHTVHFSTNPEEIAGFLRRDDLYGLIVGVSAADDPVFLVLQKLMQRERYKVLPIVLLAPEGGGEIEFKAVEIGLNHMFIQPVEASTVATRLNVLVSHYRKWLSKHKKDPGKASQPDNVSSQAIDQQGLLRGDLSQVSTAEIGQIFTLGNKTGMVTLRQGASSGTMYFEDGVLFQAIAVKGKSQDIVDGHDAAIDLLTWRQGSFKIEFVKLKKDRVIKSKFEMLALEAMRRLDEMQRTDDIPPMDKDFEDSLAGADFANLLAGMNLERDEIPDVALDSDVVRSENLLRELDFDNVEDIDYDEFVADASAESDEDAITSHGTPHPGSNQTPKPKKKKKRKQPEKDSEDILAGLDLDNIEDMAIPETNDLFGNAMTDEEDEFDDEDDGLGDSDEEVEPPQTEADDEKDRATKVYRVEDLIGKPPAEAPEEPEPKSSDILDGIDLDGTNDIIGLEEGDVADEEAVPSESSAVYRKPDEMEDVDALDVLDQAFHSDEDSQPEAGSSSSADFRISDDDLLEDEDEEDSDAEGSGTSSSGESEDAAPSDDFDLDDAISAIDSDPVMTKPQVTQEEAPGESDSGEDPISEWGFDDEGGGESTDEPAPEAEEEDLLEEVDDPSILGREDSMVMTRALTLGLDNINGSAKQEKLDPEEEQRRYFVKEWIVPDHGALSARCRQPQNLANMEAFIRNGALHPKCPIYKRGSNLDEAYNYEELRPAFDALDDLNERLNEPFEMAPEEHERMLLRAQQDLGGATEEPPAELLERVWVLPLADEFAPANKTPQSLKGLANLVRRDILTPDSIVRRMEDYPQLAGSLPYLAEAFQEKFPTFVPEDYKDKPVPLDVEENLEWPSPESLSEGRVSSHRPSAKDSRKRLLVGLGVAVVVVLLAGGGGAYYYFQVYLPELAALNAAPEKPPVLVANVSHSETYFNRADESLAYRIDATVTKPAGEKAGHYAFEIILYDDRSNVIGRRALIDGVLLEMPRTGPWEETLRQMTLEDLRRIRSEGRLLTDEPHQIEVVLERPPIDIEAVVFAPRVELPEL